MSAPEVLQKIWFIWQTHALQHGSGGAPTCLWRQRKVPRGEIHPWRLIHWDGFRSSLRIELGSKLGHLWAIHSLSRFSAQWIHRLEISGGIFGCILGQQRSKDFAPDQQLGQPPRCATQRGAAVVAVGGPARLAALLHLDVVVFRRVHALMTLDVSNSCSLTVATAWQTPSGLKLVHKHLTCWKTGRDRASTVHSIKMSGNAALAYEKRDFINLNQLNCHEHCSASFFWSRLRLWWQPSRCGLRCVGCVDDCEMVEAECRKTGIAFKYQDVSYHKLVISCDFRWFHHFQMGNLFIFPQKSHLETKDTSKAGRRRHWWNTAALPWLALDQPELAALSWWMCPNIDQLHSSEISRIVFVG